MDCKTARMLLDFVRPNAPELDPHDAQELAGHIDHCGDCGAISRAERLVDDCLGRAMRNVEVPEQLRKNLTARLNADRSDWYRRRIGYAVRVFAVAAALVLLVWGGFWMTRSGPAVLDFEALCGKYQDFRYSPSAAMLEKELRVLDYEGPAPTNLQYMFLAAPPSIAEIQKKRVPMLVFVNPRSKGIELDRACVYLLSRDKFDFKKLPEKFSSDGNYHFKVAVVQQDEDHAFVVLHTGENWDWLRIQKEMPK